MKAHTNQSVHELIYNNWLKLLIGIADGIKLDIDEIGVKEKVSEKSYTCYRYDYNS